MCRLLEQSGLFSQGGHQVLEDEGLFPVTFPLAPRGNQDELSVGRRPSVQIGFEYGAPDRP
jgi:hypothetical protein